MMQRTGYVCAVSNQNIFCNRFGLHTVCYLRYYRLIFNPLSYVHVSNEVSAKVDIQSALFLQWKGRLCSASEFAFLLKTSDEAPHRFSPK